MQSTLLPIYSVFIIQLFMISVLLPWINIFQSKKQMRASTAESFLATTGRSLEAEQKRIVTRVGLEVVVVLAGISALIALNASNTLPRMAFNIVLLLSALQLLPAWLTKPHHNNTELSATPSKRSASLSSRQLSDFLTLPMTATLIGSYAVTIVVGSYLAYQNLWPRSDTTLLLLLIFNTVITLIIGTFIYKAVYGKRKNFTDDDTSRAAKMQKLVNYRSIEIVVLNGFIAALMILVSYKGGLAAIYVSTSIIFQLVMLMSNFRKKV